MVKRGWAPAGAAAAALVLVAASGGISPTAALPSGGSSAGMAGEPRGTTAAVADDTVDGGLAARTQQSTLFPGSLSDSFGPPADRGVDGGPAGSLAPAVSATFASVRGAYPGSLVVLSAAQLQTLQERNGEFEDSSEEAPASVHRGSVPDLGVELDHPVSGPVHLSSPFGWRINPTRVGPAVQFHIGQDYPVACGTPVHAAADGTVRFAADRGTSGLRVDLDHAEGLSTAYHHNSALLVSPGDTVARGDVIALAGTTGNSTGCHVHFG
ncbi:MAG: M23 family metallopeptidase, partial [Citricoccus sp.]